MHAYQKEFIEFALSEKVLRFGEFTLKSGRSSPYFFNSGLFSDGTSMLKLARCYARAVEQSGIGFDMLFGPAYKGIALASCLAVAFDLEGRRNVPAAFNRKEAKDHGEGGMLLGAPLAGRVLIVDDVISAGTSIDQSVALIRDAGAVAAGAVVALDRQERGKGSASAVQEARQRHGIDVISIVTLADLIEYLETTPGSVRWLEAIRRYKAEYGAAAG